MDDRDTMDLTDKRIYVQLAPDTDSLAHLTDVQSRLPIPRSGRMLPAEELHLTLIHFGKADDVFSTLHGLTGVNRSDYDAALAAFVADLAPLADDTRYRLVPTGFTGLGKNGHTLVITYDARRELHDIHARTLSRLRAFFSRTGIGDPDAFMADDPNFRYARAFTPHITLYKGYDGPLPAIPLKPVRVGMMKTVY